MFTPFQESLIKALMTFPFQDKELLSLFVNASSLIFSLIILSFIAGILIFWLLAPKAKRFRNIFLFTFLHIGFLLGSLNLLKNLSIYQFYSIGLVCALVLTTIIIPLVLIFISCELKRNPSKDFIWVFVFLFVLVGILLTLYFTGFFAFTNHWHAIVYIHFGSRYILLTLMISLFLLTFGSYRKGNFALYLFLSIGFNCLDLALIVVTKPSSGPIYVFCFVCLCHLVIPIYLALASVRLGQRIGAIKTKAPKGVKKKKLLTENPRAKKRLNEPEIEERFLIAIKKAVALALHKLTSPLFKFWEWLKK